MKCKRLLFVIALLVQALVSNAQVFNYADRSNAAAGQRFTSYVSRTGLVLKVGDTLVVTKGKFNGRKFAIRTITATLMTEAGSDKEEIRALLEIGDANGNITAAIESALDDGQVILKGSTGKATSAVGSVSPQAKVLAFKSNYLNLGDFNDGCAVLKDGALTALIDPAGAMAIPYGKYSDLAIPLNGYVLAKDPKTNKLGVVDYRGQVVSPFTNDYLTVSPVGLLNAHGTPVIREGTSSYGVLKNIKGQTCKFLLEKTGKDSTLVYNYTYNFSNDLCLVSRRVANMLPDKKGFASTTGTIVIKPQYDEAQEFSEGLAAVGRRDEVGEIKWGFINTKGEVVIPLKFSVTPGPFRRGLSHITSKNGENAWMDEKGNVVFKESDYPDWKIVDGLDFESEVILVLAKKDRKYAWLHKTGTIKPFSFQLDIDQFRIQERKAGQMKISFLERNGMGDNNRGSGMLDETGAIIVPPVFDAIGFFDAKSGLATATFVKGKETTEGYINKEGVFVMVKGKPSEW
jgi:hypothetical protein